MKPEVFEEFAKKIEAAGTSSSIDFDPNIFNGSRIKTKDKDAIYLVMKGEKRYIPNPKTYTNLFKNDDGLLNGGGIGALWNKIVDTIPTGEAITDGAILIKSENSDPIYLLTNNKKYWITDPQQYSDCNFKPGGQKTYPAVVIDAIPKGENDAFKPAKV